MWIKENLLKERAEKKDNDMEVKIINQNPIL